jgi:hypothetical protein
MNQVSRAKKLHRRAIAHERIDSNGLTARSKRRANRDAREPESGNITNPRHGATGYRQGCQPISVRASARQQKRPAARMPVFPSASLPKAIRL